MDGTGERDPEKDVPSEQEVKAVQKAGRGPADESSAEECRRDAYRLR
jgi:hypothetical protein